MPRLFPKQADGDRLAWPVLLLLLMVLTPSAGVVWMMREAVQNERLAAEQRLREVYQAQLDAARKTVLEYWGLPIELLAQQSDDAAPARRFADGVSADTADSLLIRGEGGQLLYPNIASNELAQMAHGPSWQHAQRLEFAEQDYRAAAEAYRAIADDAEVAGHAAARLAEARCWLRLGEPERAIRLLQALRNSPRVAGTRLERSVELRLLQVLEPQSPQWSVVAKGLTERLGDYDNRHDENLSAAERRFLMSAVQELSAEPIDWPTRDAEELAASAAAANVAETAGPRLQRTPLPDVWSYAAPDARIVGLYRTATVGRQLARLAQRQPLPAGLRFVALAPQQDAPTLIDRPLGATFPGWRLGIEVNEGDPFDASSQQRKAVHGWIALLVVGVTCVLGWLLAGALRRRMRLARLKNDLVATVSHELKTPLASIRLLVDTLLAEEGDVPNNSTANGPTNVDSREYLQLIAQENARLTRLIDNFLTFSRLEQGKQRFEFDVVDVRDVVNQAATVVRDRWGEASNCLQVDAGPRTLVRGDVDALVTAIVNLLENAWKFTAEDKQIELVAKRRCNTAASDTVELSVRDNGPGLTVRAARRVFDRFYQVDQRVARTAGGCGLGLSIVRSIARAHGGDVKVDSDPGNGSTFTISVPCVGAASRHGDPVPASGEI